MIDPRMLEFAPCGEMAERSKAHAWKVCKGQKPFVGSNPTLSASQVFYCPETTNFCIPALGLTHTTTHIRLIWPRGIAATPKAAPAQIATQAAPCCARLDLHQV